MKIYCKEKLPKNSKKAFIQAYMDKLMPATYVVDKNYEETIQCYNYKNRSYTDLKYLLDGTFKTKTSIDDTITILMSLLKDEKIKCLLCPNINSLVFFGKAKIHWTFKFNRADGQHRDLYKSKSYANGYSFDKCIEIYNKCIKKKGN
jgi:hypothetical protein